MAYSDVSALDVATPWFAHRLDEQRRTHDGLTLRALAADVLARLPGGAVTLLSSSVEGCALAAAVSVLRDDETTWQQLTLGRPQLAHGKSVAVIEPVLLGEGMLETLRELVPGAVIIHGLVRDTPALASVA